MAPHPDFAGTENTTKAERQNILLLSPPQIFGPSTVSVPHSSISSSISIIMACPFFLFIISFRIQIGSRIQKKKMLFDILALYWQIISTNNQYKRLLASVTVTAIS